MNKKTLAILFLILLTSQLTLVLAAPFADALFGGEGILGNLVKYVFGYEGGNIRQGIVVMAVWLIIFVAISDMVAVFTAFSSFTSWMIGFGLSVIAANTGVVTGASLWAFGFAAAAGAWVTAAIVISALLAALVVHWRIGGWLQGWVLKRKVLLNASKGGTRVATAIKQLKEIEKEFEK